MQNDIGFLQTHRAAIGNTASGSHADVVSSLPVHSPYRDLRFNRSRTVDPARVLIVDADFSRCASIAVGVHIAGRFETRLAYSSGIGLAIATDFLPGIVLINTDLPDLAGYSLASALHRRSGLSGARLIALTIEIAARDRSQALAVGFEQYLTLPLEQPALERVLLPGSLSGGVQRFRRRSGRGRH
jgi:PleD family two-component response regulator